MVLQQQIIVPALAQHALHLVCLLLMETPDVWPRRISHAVPHSFLLDANLMMSELPILLVFPQNINIRP